MSEIARVRIVPESYPGAELLLDLGSEIPTVLANTGIAKWTTVTVPRRREILQFDGESLVKISFSITLNQWPDGNIEDPCGRIYGWAARIGLPFQPTIIRVYGPIPYSGLRYVITGIEQMETRRRNDGIRCYQELKLEITEYNEPDLIVQTAPTPPAVAAQARAQEAAPQNSVAGPAQKTVTVRKGETLSSIAARELGKASRWTELASLNGVRDPRKLQIGQVLKLP